MALVTTRKQVLEDLECLIAEWELLYQLSKAFDTEENTYAYKKCADALHNYVIRVRTELDE